MHKPKFFKRNKKMANENTDKDIRANLDVPENEVPEINFSEESPRVKLVINEDSSLDVFVGESLLVEGSDYDVVDNRPAQPEEGVDNESTETPENEAVEASDEANEEKKNEVAENTGTPTVDEGICPICNGRGLIDNNTACDNCNASGRVE